MRPETLEEYLGQQHIVGQEAIIYKTIQNNTVGSMIFWGPPGVGKTTLARIISKTQDRPFLEIISINAFLKY